MQVEPLEDKVQGAARHLTCHLARLDVNSRVIFVVTHVKVWRIVVGQIHRNYDSVEVANLWHNCIVFLVSECKSTTFS